MRFSDRLAQTAVRHRCNVLLAAAMLVALASGCGVETYERRLAAAGELYRFEETLNANLHGAWNDGGYGVQMRVPLQFAMIPPPAPPEPVEGEENSKNGENGSGEKADPSPVVDERQPTYINMELPGLLGAFRADLAVDSGDTNAESTPQEPAFIYVLGNQSILLDGGAANAATNFQDNFVKEFAQAIGEPIKEDAWTSLSFPVRCPSFIDKVSYNFFEIVTRSRLQGSKRRIQVYRTEQGDTKVIVLVVLPENVLPSERIDDRLGMAMGTLSLGGSGGGSGSTASTSGDSSGTTVPSGGSGSGKTTGGF